MNVKDQVMSQQHSLPLLFLASQYWRQSAKEHILPLNASVLSLASHPLKKEKEKMYYGVLKTFHNIFI